MTKRVVFAVSALLAVVAVRAARAQTTHEIRLEADPASETFRYSPAEVTARPGDVLIFRAVKGGPHSVSFEDRGMPAGARALLSAALTDRTSDLGSPMIAEKETYRVVLPANLPKGRYAFYCLPHRAYDMRGTLVVR